MVFKAPGCLLMVLSWLLWFFIVFSSVFHGSRLVFMVSNRSRLFFFRVPGRILWFSRFQVGCYGFHGSSSVFQDSMLVFIGFGLS